MKKILVPACKNCPKLAIKWNDERKGYTDYVCRLVHKKDQEDIIIEDFSVIPDWCPLSDDKQVVLTKPLSANVHQVEV